MNQTPTGTPAQPIPATQHAVQIVGVDEIVVNTAKPVDPVGPTQLLLQVEACGICFSDTKLLHAFETHPRKVDVVSGLTPAQLAEIPSYHPGSAPTVPGHEPVGRIVAIGDAVEHFSVGDRVLVQADWKHLKTARSNGAFGYNFEGALQEYVVIDERCVVSPDGEEFLLHVAEEPSAAAVGLIEPWATVEAAYAAAERQGLQPGGRLLLVADADTETSGAHALSEAAGCEVTLATADGLDLIAGQTFDDIIYYGSDAATLGELGQLLGLRAILNVVLDGARIDGPVQVDVGRVHYDYIRYCGTTGSDPAEGYTWLPATGEIRAGDAVAVVGAAGPMGLMHTMRAVTLGSEGIDVASVVATDLNDDRLAHLASEIDPVAAERGVKVSYVNTGEEQLQPGFDYLACMVPVPALVAQAVELAGPGGVVNAFAGIPAGTFGEVNLQHLIENRVFLFGTSGSDVKDMATVLRKIEAGIVDTTISLDAVCGIAGFDDAINAVMNRTSGGKIMVFPQLHDLPFTRLVDLAGIRPDVADKLADGRWTVEAEKALLGR
ncbi:alcohol dehydrogenase catalytic domain-containing protein [Propioniciclava soli]|uniref:Alcohol dehydrogenase catalytic domain-containing protein n=1 Tax=Propioniciclava soli TaxID=2775081 RepID=A0ABZ3C7S1_9ACTN